MRAEVPHHHPLLVQFREDPYPLYRYLHAAAPVQWNECRQKTAGSSKHGRRCWQPASTHWYPPTGDQITLRGLKELPVTFAS